MTIETFVFFGPRFRAQRRTEPPADGGLFVRDPAKWLESQRRRRSRRRGRKGPYMTWEREKARFARHRQPIDIEDLIRWAVAQRALPARGNGDGR